MPLSQWMQFFDRQFKEMDYTCTDKSVRNLSMLQCVPDIAKIRNNQPNTYNGRNIRGIDVYQERSDSKKEPNIQFNPQSNMIDISNAMSISLNDAQFVISGDWKIHAKPISNSSMYTLHFTNQNWKNGGFLVTESKSDGNRTPDRKITLISKIIDE